jgi:hypothetical protein
MGVRTTADLGVRSCRDNDDSPKKKIHWRETLSNL